MKKILLLLVVSSVTFTSCKEKQQNSTAGQQAPEKKEAREDAVILKENGELRVKPLQGMDLVKDAPQPPEVPVVAQEESVDNLSLATTSKSIQSGHIELKNVTTSQSPMMRAIIRTQAMDEMARRKNQAAENQK